MTHNDVSSKVLDAMDAVDRLKQLQELVTVALEAADTYTPERFKRIQIMLDFYLESSEQHFADITYSLEQAQESFRTTYITEKCECETVPFGWE